MPDVIEISLHSPELPSLKLDDAVVIIPAMAMFQTVRGWAPGLLKAKHVLPLVADAAMALHRSGRQCVDYWDVASEIGGDRLAVIREDFKASLERHLPPRALSIALASQYSLNIFLRQCALADDVCGRFLESHPEVGTVVVTSWGFQRPSVAEMPTDAAAAAVAAAAERCGRRVINVVLPDDNGPLPMPHTGVVGPVEEQLQEIRDYQQSHPRRPGTRRVAVDASWLYRPADLGAALAGQGIEPVFLLHAPVPSYLDVDGLSQWGPIFALLRPPAQLTEPWARFTGALPLENEEARHLPLLGNPYLAPHFRFYAEKYWPALEQLAGATQAYARTLDVDAWILPTTDIPSIQVIFQSLGEAVIPRIMMPHGMPFDRDRIYHAAEGFGFWSSGDEVAYPPTSKASVRMVTGRPASIERIFPDQDAARRKTGLPPDKPVVLMLSSAVALGDTPFVHFGDHLRALKTLLGQVPEGVHLAIRPKPYWDDPAFYPRLMEELGAAGSVTMSPATYEGEDLFDQISAADLVVTVNVFSTALLDAVRAGRPALCLTNTPTELLWGDIFPPIQGESRFWPALTELLHSAEAWRNETTRQSRALGRVENKDGYASAVAALVNQVADHFSAKAFSMT